MSNELPGEPVPRARDNVKQLRQGVDKVNYLRNEEKQHCFAEVSQNTNYSKGHPSKVTKSVSNKHRWRVPVMKQVVS